METCPHCSSDLPPVAYFCPICGVKLVEGQPPPGPVKFRPAASDGDANGQQPGTAPPRPQVAPPGWRVSRVTGPEMLGPAFMAGLAGGVLVGVPGINNLSCLWMLSSGILAVFFFRKQFGRSALPNEAARLGVMSGFFGFLVAFFVSFLSMALIRRNPLGLVESLRENMQRSVQLVKPDDAAKIQEVLNSPGGNFILVATLATFYFFSFLALSMLGSLLAGALSRRR